MYTYYYKSSIFGIFFNVYIFYILFVIIVTLLHSLRTQQGTFHYMLYLYNCVHDKWKDLNLRCKGKLISCESVFSMIMSLHSLCTDAVVITFVTKKVFQLVHIVVFVWTMSIEESLLYCINTMFCYAILWCAKKNSPYDRENAKIHTHTHCKLIYTIYLKYNSEKWFGKSRVPRKELNLHF